MKAKIPHLLLVTASICFGCSLAPLSFAAPGICWVESIKSTQDEVSVSLRKNYRSALWAIERVDGTSEFLATSSSEIPYFTLREGDAARLRIGNHDSCDMVGRRREGVLGVEITAFNRQTGLPLIKVTEFATD